MSVAGQKGRNVTCSGARSAVRGHQKSARIHSNAGACFQHQTESSIHPQILKQARASGQLNLSGKGMVKVPEVVWNFHSLNFEESKSVSVAFDTTDSGRWWESVDLTKLHLASNKLSSISEEIKNYASLTVLDLHDNQITSLPDSLRELRQLRKFDISRNRLEALPECVFQLVELQDFNASYNKLDDLHDDIGNLSRLESFNVSNNNLTAIPHTIGFLSRVTTLNLSNNKIEKLPNDMSSMSALQVLDLTHNNVRELPNDIGLLQHLEQLYLRHNELTSLPDEYEFPNLKELHVGNNSLTNISERFLECLVAIRVLDLRDNKVGVLPESISRLQGLERLDVTNNDIAVLPYSLGNLVHLKSLSIDGNLLKNVRRDIVQRGTVQLLKWLKSRMEENSPSRPVSGNFANRESDLLEVLDKHSLHASRSLNVSNKGMTHFPKKLASMAEEAEISVVDLSKNSFVDVPESLQPLCKRMSELKMGFNKISILPGFLGMSPNLSYLDLRNNQLSELPTEFAMLCCLREINITCNRFQHLPDVVYELKKLEIILAADNKIQDINVAGLSKLAMLATLDLGNNDIHHVPPELGTLTGLRALQLEGNPSRNPRVAILAKGTQAVLEYLRGRIPQT